MNDFTRLFFLVGGVGSLIAYLYFNHWEQFHPLFGYGILFIVFSIILIGIGAVITFLHNANKNANFQVLKFMRTFGFFLACLFVALPLFWVSEPLIYKSISTTIGERIMPDWYYKFFEREKPDFEPIKHEKYDLF